MFLSAACSSNMRLSEEEKLKRELKKWESFSGDGIAEISAFGISLRKPFHIAKSMDQMRMDIIEGGLMGATGSPLVSIYMGEYFSLKSTLMPALEALNIADKIPMSPLSALSSSEQIFDRFGAEIIANKAIIRDSLEIRFRKNYQLESAVDKASGTRLEAAYNSKGDLDELDLRIGKGMAATLIFDSVDYEPPQIIALERKEATSDGLMDILNQGGLFDLLKGFMGEQ
jgi:hypothetical protein